MAACRARIERELRQQRDPQAFLDRYECRQRCRGKALVLVESDTRKAGQRMALQAMAPFEQHELAFGQILARDGTTVR